MPTAKIIVLANSRKLGGRCVAGISPRSGRMIRPVSSHPHGELDDTHCEVDGRQVRELDVISLQYTKRLRDPAHPENVLVADRPWELLGRLDRESGYAALAPFIQPDGPLFGNCGKAVPESKAALGLDSSLALIEPADGVVFRLRPPEKTQGQLKPRAVFTFGGREQALAITDYAVAPLVKRRGVGDHDAEALGLGASRVLLTISLAEPKNGWCTKLVAGVLWLAPGPEPAQASSQRAW